MEELSCNSTQSVSAYELLARMNVWGDILLGDTVKYRDDIVFSTPKNFNHVYKKMEDTGGSPSFKVIMVFPFVMLSIMILMFVDVCVFLLRKANNLRRTGLMLWVISIYPVLGSFCVTGLYMPRTAAVVTFARNFYFAVAMKKFFDLVLNYHGGKKKMVEALNGAIVPANPIPFCCVLCDRNQPLSVWRLKKLKATVYQVVLVYPIAYYIETLLASEGLLQSSIAARLALIVIEALVAVSSFVCLYGFAVIGRASRFTLQQYFIAGKYFSVNLVVACNTLQSFILNILQRFDVLPCYFPYPDPLRAFLFQNYILLFELFVISLLGWYSYRRLDNNSQVTSVTLPDLSFSNIFENKKQALEIKVGGDGSKEAKYDVEGWLGGKEKYKPSEITV